ncbi:MAG: bifunctional demethylmenaquinone methyltransferase/2-methoxy-6-polyprenyl-1,4-benzoquinol methylase UbiE [Synechococcales cyanobacterium]
MPTSEFSTATDVQALFDRIAPHYDALNDRLSFGLHQIWKTMAVQWADPPQGSRVLDVCCGSGDLALILARYVGSRGEVVGLDFSGPLLSIAAQRAQLTYPCHRFDWVLGDALALPFAENSFDAVTMGYGLRNVVDIPRCLQHLYRVLQPGATMAILDFQKPRDPWLQRWQEWYMQSWVVPRAAAMGIAKEYEYILPSLERFPDGATQGQLAQQAGFRDCHYYSLALGLMGVLVATKPKG